MLKIFRKKPWLQSLIIAATGVLLWGRAFLNPPPLTTENGGPLFYWIIEAFSPIGAVIGAAVLVLAEGALFNAVLVKNKMINSGSLLPMLFFVVAMSLGQPQLTLTPMLAGTLFLVLCTNDILTTTSLVSLTLGKIFGAAGSIALASLFCPPMAVCLIALAAVMINYSLYSGRDWTMLVLGFLSPYLIVETYYFMTDQLFYRNFLLYCDITDLHLRIGGTAAEWVSSSLFLLLFVVSIAGALDRSQSSTSNYKKNLWALLLLVIGSAAFTAYSRLVPLPSQSFALPFATCSSILFLEPKRREWPWSLALVLVLAAFIICNLI